MEQIAEQITQDLLQDLPGQTQFFTPNELLSSGIPNILVQTIRKNVLLTIESEMKLPESEWVQTEREQVQEAWQHFVEVAGETLRIPASKLSNLLEEAVEQCLELALKPRQSVPEIIFRTRDVIDLETVKKRVESIEVNNQLGLALLRYMEKKEQQEISIEKARELIKKVDQRLVEDYHPLNWTQALKPVFDLVGPAVDSDLFRIFFEDKEKPAYARKFELLEKDLTETEFIEVLSSADVLDVEGYADEQPELFVPVEQDAEPEEIVDIEQTPDEDFSDGEEGITSEDDEPSDNWVEDEPEVQTYVDDELEESKNEVEGQEKQEPVESVQMENVQTIKDETWGEEDNEDDVQEEEKDEDNIVDLFSQIRNEDLLEEDEERKEPVLTLVDDEDDNDADKDNITLLSKFMFDESVDDAVDEAPEESSPTEEKEPTSIYEEMNLVKDDLSDLNRKKDFFEESDDVEGENEEELSFKIEDKDEELEEVDYEPSIELEEDSVEPDSEDDDQPMWRSFLERDDLETDSGYEYEEEAEDEENDLEENEFIEEEDDGFIEEPIYDLTTDEDLPEEKMSKISKWLDDEKDRFVDEIFKGSEVAYEEALIEIIEYENWKAASMYLEREIFSRNKVDVYDEAAVDFTDRLHSYFLEYNSKQDE